MIVSAACVEAGRLGLRPGMKLAQAQAMIPDLTIVPARPDQDDEALAALAEWCRRYSPFTRPEPPDGIWLDLTGCTHLFGGEASLLADLASRIGRTGLAARLAIAATPGAAHAIAHHGTDPFVQVPHEQTRAALAPLPAAALRLEPEQTTLLHRFGLHTVGQLDAVPRGPLTRRLGAAVMLRLDQALGRSDEPIHPDLPVILLQERLAFLEPLMTRESLQAANEVLATALCRTLEAACLGARRLDLVFIRLDGSSCVQTVALARPSHAPRHIGRLLDERLEQVDPGEGIETIWLVARFAEPVAADQSVLRTLVHDALKSEAEMLRDLAPLIDTLQNRLGAGRLWRPVPVESDVPERTVGRQPPLAMSNSRSTHGALSDTWPLESWPGSLPRPVRLIDPPQLVSAMAGLPDHAPVAFTWRSRRHRVRHADGPERIAGEWWLRPGEMFAVRDYFRVEDEDGRRFWLFRRGDGTDLGTGDLTWFLHGLF
jgi:protein ImuB